MKGAQRPKNKNEIKTGKDDVNKNDKNAVGPKNKREVQTGTTTVKTNGDK